MRVCLGFESTSGRLEKGVHSKGSRLKWESGAEWIGNIDWSEVAYNGVLSTCRSLKPPPTPSLCSSSETSAAGFSPLHCDS